MPCVTGRRWGWCCDCLLTCLSGPSLEGALSFSFSPLASQDCERSWAVDAQGERLRQSRYEEGNASEARGLLARRGSLRCDLPPPRGTFPDVGVVGPGVVAVVPRRRLLGPRRDL